MGVGCKKKLNVKENIYSGMWGRGSLENRDNKYKGLTHVVKKKTKNGTHLEHFYHTTFLLTHV